MVRTIRLWEQYLLTHADIDRDLVDPDAEVIESLLPVDVVHELEVGLVRSGRRPVQPFPERSEAWSGA